MQVLLDTKTEYIDHLLDIITIPLAKNIYKMYDASNGNIKVFQQFLVEIKNWNNNKIYDEYQLLLKKTKCNYFEKLLKEIVILNIKIKTENASKIKDISIIKPYDFIHRCMMNISIFCWKNVYLFSSKNLKPSEKQYHLNLIEKNIRKILKNTIRDITPFETILELYNEKVIESDTEEEEDNIEEEESDNEEESESDDEEDSEEDTDDTEDDSEEDTEDDSEEDTEEDSEDKEEIKIPKIKIIEPEKTEVVETQTKKKEIVKTPRIKKIDPSEETSIEPDETPIEPEQILIEPKQIPIEPDETSIEPEQIPIEPKQIPIEPDETSIEPEQIPIEPEQIPIEPEQILIEPVETLIETPRIKIEPKREIVMKQEENETDEENYINTNLFNNIKKKTNKVLEINSDNDSSSDSDNSIIEKDDSIKKINIKGIRKSRYY